MNASERAAELKALQRLALEAVANGVKPEDAQALFERCLARLMAK